MLGWDRDFEKFRTYLELGLLNDLPGFEAQFKLVPPTRNRPDFKEIERQNPRIAGVLALFYPVENVPHLVLMKRNTYPGVHSGQISLPGGQKENIDHDLIATALRETHEEIGVKPDTIDVLGYLTKVFIPPSNFLVQPVVGVMASKPSFVPDVKEVDELLEIPFSLFSDARNFKETTVQARNLKMKVPAYHVNNEIIWGATAMMISELTHLLKPRDR
jgi:8-oxo-dGTP pyrophosphatase MutT (NUDIX family)